MGSEWLRDPVQTRHRFLRNGATDSPQPSHAHATFAGNDLGQESNVLQVHGDTALLDLGRLATANCQLALCNIAD